MQTRRGALPDRFYIPRYQDTDREQEVNKKETNAHPNRLRRVNHACYNILMLKNAKDHQRKRIATRTYSFRMTEEERELLFELARQEDRKARTILMRALKEYAEKETR
jgi:hypothetical protein